MSTKNIKVAVAYNVRSSWLSGIHVYSERSRSSRPPLLKDLVDHLKNDLRRTTLVSLLFEHDGIPQTGNWLYEPFRSLLYRKSICKYATDGLRQEEWKKLREIGTFVIDCECRNSLALDPASSGISYALRSWLCLHEMPDLLDAIRVNGPHACLKIAISEAIGKYSERTRKLVSSIDNEIGIESTDGHTFVNWLTELVEVYWCKMNLSSEVPSREEIYDLFHRHTSVSEFREARGLTKRQAYGLVNAVKEHARGELS